ncbi:MAG: hypothetical protein OES09_05275 [Gammaproteobacteria bacterium]|nr:hypothetical protein [Gammaproteobacteria bacterium]
MSGALHRMTLLFALGLAACNGGGTGGAGGGSSGGSDSFAVNYTHVANLANWEWAVDWFVEEAGNVAGPFNSGGTGVVGLGQPSTPSVHVTRREAFFYFTFMDAPVAPISYYTGDRDPASPNRNVTVNLTNTMVGDELMLFYPFPNWWDIDQEPYSLTQTVASADLIADDGTASVFINYRGSGTEEPMSRYGFQVDLLPSALSSVAFDVNALRQRTVTRQWQSSEMLTGSALPYLWARRKGIFLITGESTSGGLTSGLIGVPDQFPADSWYLVSGPTLLPEIVQAVDPASPDIIAMQPVSGFIDENTIDYDANAGTFSVTAPGAMPVHFGHLRLVTNSEVWEIYFPTTALQISGDVVTLSLPQHPAHSQLPSFNAVTIEFYRLDRGATAESMYRYLWNRSAHALPSFAMQSEFTFL